MRRIAIIVLLFAACVAYGQDWHTLGALWSEPGAVAELLLGNAVDLDGSTEYLQDASTSLLNGATQLTMCCWVNLRTNYAINGFIYYANGGNQMSGLRTGASTNQIAFQVGGASGNSISTASSIPTGVWTFVVGRWTVSNSPLLWINGALPTSYASGVVNNQNVDQRTKLKIGFADYGTQLKGLIDEIAIYKNRYLTDSEVAELWNGGIGSPITSNKVFSSTGVSATNNLVRLWSLNESGSAANATDIWNNVATGTQIGSGDWVTGKVPLP